jgi:hypothetical protein
MNDQDLTQIPATGEDEDDDAPAIDRWSIFWALLLGVGFVVHMTFLRSGGEPTPWLHRRIRFFFILLGGVAIAAMALAGLARMKKSRPKPPTSQDLA